MALFGLGRRNDVHRAKKKAWSIDVERGRKIREGQLAELKRRKAIKAAETVEAKRVAEIARRRKNIELLKTRASERRAITEERRASRAGRIGSSLFGGAERSAGRVGRTASKSVRRRQKGKTKIDWF